jgi:predicted DNA binding CopG/RHH family protein
MDEYLLAQPEILQWAHKNKPEVLYMTKLAQDQYESAKKTKQLTIRLNERDLIKLKSKAITLGIPYQTLIGSQIRQFVNS